MGSGSGDVKRSRERLTAGPRELFGREEDLEWLDAAWGADAIKVVTIVAWGGVGKTALVSDWRKRLLADGGAHGVESAFEWSFYSQGAQERAAVSADSFLREALVFFGDEEMAGSSASPLDKGARLAELVGARRSLLILDGLEPLQFPPTSAGSGALKEKAIGILLRDLAARNGGLCVVTTRERVCELEDYEDGAAPCRELAHLGEVAGAELLRSLLEGGARPKVVVSTAEEREEISKEVQGHALTLLLLGSFVRRALGDVRRWREIDLRRADDSVQGGHAFRVMDAYVRWLSGGQRGFGARVLAALGLRAKGAGSEGERQLAVLRLLGLFDRPADPGCVGALRESPVIAGLTEVLVGLDVVGWRLLVTSLEEARLITQGEYVPMQVRGYDEATAEQADRERALLGEPEPWPLAEFGNGAMVLDAHPLVREYFARELKQANPDGWREGHRRLYAYLCESVPYWPEAVEGLQPLYQAVAHGCAAGRVQDACDAVYFGRILRGARCYSTKQLGAISADLGAVACMFERAWDRPSTELTEADRSWVLNEAAFSLRGLGRLSEALEPMRAVLKMCVELENWENAAIAAGNLSELELTLGHTRAAVDDAQQAVDHADRSEDDFQRTSKRTALADARLQAGEHAGARVLFEQAESMQAQHQPTYPQLYSLRGHRYCDLLLCPAERAAWRGSPGDATHDGELIELCTEVFARATRALEMARRQRSLLDIALDQLTLGRAALYAASLRARTPTAATPTAPELSFAIARKHVGAAVDGLRNAGYQDYLPKGLLTRAWLHHHDNHHERARADLDEASTIAERGPMPLFQADIHLTHARLFQDRKALVAARELITRHEYGRRLPELEDAEQAALSWPDPPPEQIATPSKPPATTIMPTTKLRILHISDIHFRSANGSDKRAEQIKRETPKRARVIAGRAWQDNIGDILGDGPIDLVCLTGDIADYGHAEEFEQGTRFVQELLRALSLTNERLFVVPGNHDIDRSPAKQAWAGIRKQSWTTRAELSDWMAGAEPPPGVEDTWRDHVCERQAAFWSWVEHGLGRPELLPAQSPHKRLGYRVDVSKTLGLSVPVWILGLDTAWLAGDDGDAGKLLLTKDQLLLQGTGDDGHALPGFRLALGHHPLGELADVNQARRLLGDYADLYLHGHQHEPIAALMIDPDRGLLELAAGCLFEGQRKDEHVNGFEVITLELDDRGRPQRGHLRFRSWAPRGHWHDDSSIYRHAKDGRLTIEWPTAEHTTSPQPPDVAVPPPSPSSSRALDRWREKLEFLLEEEPTTVGAEHKFALRKRIEEAREKIREYGGDT